MKNDKNLCPLRYSDKNSTIPIFIIYSVLMKTCCNVKKYTYKAYVFRYHLETSSTCFSLQQPVVKDIFADGLPKNLHSQADI